MIDIILTIIILALLAYHAYTQKLNKEEREKLVNAVMSKNAVELRDLEIAGNTKIDVKPMSPPDLEPLENLSNDEHLKAILKQVEKVEEENG